MRAISSDTICPGVLHTCAGRPRRRPDFTDTNQYRAYQGCLLQHFKQHRWLAFIDADEFFVLTSDSNSSGGHSSSPGGSGSGSSTAGKPAAAMDQAGPTNTQQQQQQPAQEQRFGIVNQLGSVITQEAVSGAGDTPSIEAGASSVVGSNSTDMYQHNLALFLSEYEGQAALGVNWVLFGSSGHLVRPADGPLAAYTACIPRTHWESTHVKVSLRQAVCVCLGLVSGSSSLMQRVCLCMGLVSSSSSSLVESFCWSLELVSSSSVVPLTTCAGGGAC